MRTNREYLNQIKAKASGSVYWMRKAENFYTYDYYEYAPMIKDELFLSLFKDTDVVGVIDVEQMLGRNLKVEELKPCSLSVRYLLFGSPLITETEEEAETLLEFEILIEEGINRSERRTIGYEIKRLYNILTT